MLSVNKNKKIKYFSHIILSLLLLNFFIFPHISLAETVYSGGDSEVNDLQKQIEAKQSQISELENKIKEYDDSIEYYRSQAVTLSSQVSYLNARIEKTEAEIELTENQIAENALQIQDAENKIRQNESDITKNKKYLSEFIQEIYKMDQQSELEILLANDSLSDYFNEMRSLSLVQNKIQSSLSELKQFKDDLAKHIAELDAKKLTLKNLRDKLDKNKESLEEQAITKQNILSQTRNSESKFQNLLSSVKSEQTQINAEITSLEKKIRQKLAEQGVDPLEALSSSGFIWPVPNRGVTAYFHDPDYPFRYIFEHPAVDLRASQGTPIKAPADGYVAKVSINGTKYGYIMIVHADGFSTVFGHTSASYVKEDQFVSQGDIIGLTGGMPGTTGSGNLSTGPHLHFEVRKDGIPVNPLNYLP